MNDVDEPVDALTEAATGNGGYARTGTIDSIRYSLGGLADAETAAARSVTARPSTPGRPR